jgi:hypothetical protein
MFHAAFFIQTNINICFLHISTSLRGSTHRPRKQFLDVGCTGRCQKIEGLDVYGNFLGCARCVPKEPRVNVHDSSDLSRQICSRRGVAGCLTCKCVGYPALRDGRPPVQRVRNKSTISSCPFLVKQEFHFLNRLDHVFLDSTYQKAVKVIATGPAGPL